LTSASGPLPNNPVNVFSMSFPPDAPVVWLVELNEIGANATLVLAPGMNAQLRSKEVQCGD
jgi:hypothetical protein